MPIVSEFGGELVVSYRETGTAGGFTHTHDHVFGTPANMSARCSLSRIESLFAGRSDGAAIGFTQVRFINDAGAVQNDVFARAPTGPGGVAVDKWPSFLFRPRVQMFTVAAFAIQATMRGSWYTHVWG